MADRPYCVFKSLHHYPLSEARGRILVRLNRADQPGNMKKCSTFEDKLLSRNTLDYYFVLICCIKKTVESLHNLITATHSLA